MIQPSILIAEGSVIDNDVIGRLEIGRFHSNGANSKVHLATDNDGNEFAVKIHRARKLSNGTIDTSFSTEPIIDAKGDGICTPLSTQVVNLEGDRASLVVILPSLSEYMILSQFLNEVRTISIASRIEISIQIIESLFSLHSQGWLHGDISSRNIMVHPDLLDVKLIDFEWSLELNHITSEGTKASGTPEMIPPEVRWHGLAALSQASEVWSIAKILMMLLANDAEEEFRRIDDVGVLEYAKQKGKTHPIYQPTFIESIPTTTSETICQATCAYQDARPGLLELLESLRQVDVVREDQIKLSINSPEDGIIDLQEDNIGVEITLDDGCSVKVRRGRERSISYPGGIKISFNLERISNPIIKIVSGVAEMKGDLRVGTVIKIGDMEICIKSVEVM